MQEIQKYIAIAAQKYGMTLSVSDFTIIQGEAYIDGMEPGEWLYAMHMD